MVYWLALATSLSVLTTTVVGLYEVIKKLGKVKETSEKNMEHIIHLEHRINGRLDELLQLARDEALIQGYQKGIEDERNRQERGESGVSGIQGPQGEQGIPGVQGIQGPQGKQGISGEHRLRDKPKTQTGEEGHHLHDH